MLMLILYDNMQTALFRLNNWTSVTKTKKINFFLVLIEDRK